MAKNKLGKPFPNPTGQPLWMGPKTRKLALQMMMLMGQGDPRKQTSDGDTFFKGQTQLTQNNNGFFNTLADSVGHVGSDNYEDQQQHTRQNEEATKAENTNGFLPWHPYDENVPDKREFNEDSLKGATSAQKFHFFTSLNRMPAEIIFAREKGKNLHSQWMIDKWMKMKNKELAGKTTAAGFKMGSDVAQQYYKGQSMLRKVGNW